MCKVIRLNFSCGHQVRTRLSKCRGTSHKETRRGKKVASCCAGAYLQLKRSSACGSCLQQEWERPWLKRIETAKLFHLRVDEKRLPGPSEVAQEIQSMTESYAQAAWQVARAYFPTDKVSVERASMGQKVKEKSPLSTQIWPELVVNVHGTESQLRQSKSGFVPSQLPPIDIWDTSSLEPDIDCFPPEFDHPATTDDTQSSDNLGYAAWDFDFVPVEEEEDFVPVQYGGSWDEYNTAAHYGHPWDREKGPCSVPADDDSDLSNDLHHSTPPTEFGHNEWDHDDTESDLGCEEQILIAPGPGADMQSTSGIVGLEGTKSSSWMHQDQAGRVLALFREIISEVESKNEARKSEPEEKSITAVDNSLRSLLTPTNENDATIPDPPLILSPTTPNFMRRTPSLSRRECSYLT
ncbi:hypothetical protein BCR34DRAFT_190315 [Clohesyomyces aquaticus]|uniref:Uncharacterized protein n=1 Tax=Clohesyomyces aquaticus TaxID=1231657 RepID=A0A1Y1ZY24_9PLEO|nr:hypothetical protein BCR34DRAFT_190315 [Clohesyomyces aquaticus]